MARGVAPCRLKLRKFRRVGYWENTTYFQHDDARVVADALVALFAEEGREQIARPAERQLAIYDPMQYGNGRYPLCGLAVFPGGSRWVVIKTAPLEVLGERAPGGTRMRLVELAAKLEVAGFQLNVYDGSQAVLVETDGRGQCLLSGFSGHGEDRDNPLDFHGELISEERLTPRFDLLPLQQHVDASRYQRSDSVDYSALAEALSVALGHVNAQWCDNQTSVDILACHKPLPMQDGIELYFQLQERLESDFGSHMNRR